MSLLHVSHSNIVQFADSRVNLKREDAKKLRDQVNTLRDRVEQYLAENPDFVLKKMLLSGSLAKGTSLKTINDIDVAVYISRKDAPAGTNELIPWLAEKIRQTFPNFKPEQVIENPFTVTVQFSESGLRIDIVPIFYEGDSNWRGHLLSNTGDKVLTSIPLHIEFIRKRKAVHDVHYAQVVRLLKHWKKYQQSINEDFRFKSFMIELVVAHLVDNGLSLSDYPEALASVFNYIAVDGLKTPIAFGDYYDPSDCASCTDPLQIWDPVNPENNTANRYTENQRQAIVEAALEAGDAIESALHATTKEETLRYWRKVLGPSFEI